MGGTRPCLASKAHVVLLLVALMALQGSSGTAIFNVFHNVPDDHRLDLVAARRGAVGLGPCERAILRYDRDNSGKDRLHFRQ